MPSYEGGASAKLRTRTIHIELLTLNTFIPNKFDSTFKNYILILI